MPSQTQEAKITDWLDNEIRDKVSKEELKDKLENIHTLIDANSEITNYKLNSITLTLEKVEEDLMNLRENSDHDCVQKTTIISLQDRLEKASVDNKVFYRWFLGILVTIFLGSGGSLFFLAKSYSDLSTKVDTTSEQVSNLRKSFDDKMSSKDNDLLSEIKKLIDNSSKNSVKNSTP